MHKYTPEQKAELDKIGARLAAIKEAYRPIEVEAFSLLNELENNSAQMFDINTPEEYRAFSAAKECAIDLLRAGRITEALKIFRSEGVELPEETMRHI